MAILYATMHDFKEEAVLSCLRQTYRACHVFILDDSLDEEYKRRVDRFAQQHSSQTTVVRRADRIGYKAGSLNNALRTVVRGFPYFAVVDADSVAPPAWVISDVVYPSDRIQ